MDGASQPENAPSDDTVSIISVSYENQSCEITVRPDESILDALERQVQHVKVHLPSLPDLPSDCRRGNCLTCAASWNSQHENAQPVVTTRDGLSPTMSRLVADKGYILTCSSYVRTSPASSSTLSLQLGVHHNVWQDVYASPGRFTTSHAQWVARSAVARVLRQSAERNMDEWTRQTEQMLQQTSDE